MKTTLLTTILTLAIFSNTVFAASDATLTTYKGNSTINLTYFAAGWGLDASDGFEKGDNGCSIVGTILIGAITLGILPLVVCAKSTLEKNTTTEISLKVDLNELENGRATLQLSTDKIKNCAGFSNKIFAEDDGFGSYDLYATKDAWSNGEKMGSASKNGNKLQVIFHNDIQIPTLGKKDKTCVLKLAKNNNIELSSVQK